MGLRFQTLDSSVVGSTSSILVFTSLLVVLLIKLSQENMICLTQHAAKVISSFIQYFLKIVPYFEEYGSTSTAVLSL